MQTDLFIAGFGRDLEPSVVCNESKPVIKDKFVSYCVSNANKPNSKAFKKYLTTKTK